MLKIVKFGSPVLRKKCRQVREITPEIRDLIQEMLKTLRVAQGVGLAAPQVSRDLRIIVVDIDQNPISLVNPEILKKSRELVAGEEGCLSLPGLILKIKRPRWAVVEGCRPSDGQKIKIKAEGLLARVLQHEIEHLDGILILDRISFWQRWQAIKKLKRALKRQQ